MPNIEFIRRKIQYYLDKSIEAEKKGDAESKLNHAKMLVVLARLDAMKDIAEERDCESILCAIKRSKRKAEAQGVTFLFADEVISELEAELDMLRRNTEKSVNMLYAGLGLWKSAGATCQDLLNLCNLT